VEIEEVGRLECLKVERLGKGNGGKQKRKEVASDASKLDSRKAVRASGVTRISPGEKSREATPALHISISN
jgi:hypothetical protein